MAVQAVKAGARAEDRQGYTGIVEWPDRIDRFTVWLRGQTIWFGDSHDEAERILRKCEDKPVTRFALYQRRKRAQERAAL